MVWSGFRKLGLHKKKDTEELDERWMRCRKCNEVVYKEDFEQLMSVCPECNFHNTMGAKKRADTMLDEGSFSELFHDLTPVDPLEFNGKRPYHERLSDAQNKTGLADACVVGTGTIDGRDVAFGVTDPQFLMGSMGSVVGEKICRIAETALKRTIPLVFVSGSGGGARMDEGMLSLMQMAKTAAALSRLHEASIMFISILTHPTMGGAMASFAALGDFILAEPGALVGFAGPNVIKQTIHGELPKGFQRSEFLLEKGFLDMIVNRVNLRPTVSKLLCFCDMSS
jgi:acetyl-CoA carboxylase carboxyl transferase subunit beta